MGNWSSRRRARDRISVNGGDDGTRTRGLCRDSAAGNGFTTTYKHAGTAKRRIGRTRLQELWVGMWVGKAAAEAPALFRQHSSADTNSRRVLRSH